MSQDQALFSSSVHDSVTRAGDSLRVHHVLHAKWDPYCSVDESDQDECDQTQQELDDSDHGGWDVAMNEAKPRI